MDRSLFLVRIKILDAKGVCDSAVTGPYSAIISHSCNYVGTYVDTLIDFFFPWIFQLDLVTLFVRVIYLITIYMFIVFINEVLFSFPDYFPVYVMTLIYNWIAFKY